jgi:hypothetical protein
MRFTIILMHRELRFPMRSCVTTTDLRHRSRRRQHDPEFEPFFTSKLNGMGMGLVICRSFVRARGWCLSALSDREFGTVFRFILAARAGNRE